VAKAGGVYLMKLGSVLTCNTLTVQYSMINRYGGEISW
jgi:hypothetical protein